MSCGGCLRSFWDASFLARQFDTTEFHDKDFDFHRDGLFTLEALLGFYFDDFFEGKYFLVGTFGDFDTGFFRQLASAQPMVILAMGVSMTCFVMATSALCTRACRPFWLWMRDVCLASSASFCAVCGFIDMNMLMPRCRS